MLDALERRKGDAVSLETVRSRWLANFKLDVVGVAGAIVLVELDGFKLAGQGFFEGFPGVLVPVTQA